MINFDCIVWDFDGVLNKNARDRKVFWADTFETDTGQCRKTFEQFMFIDGHDDLATGRIDLLDKLQNWADHVGYTPGAAHIINYWYARDRMPDAQLLNLVHCLNDAGITQVIGTNSAAHRANFVEHDMGYGAHVEKIYASGRIGACKPHQDFFHHITNDLKIAPDRIILIDDFEENIDGAKACGWHAHHFQYEGYTALNKALGLPQTQPVSHFPNTPAGGKFTFKS